MHRLPRQQEALENAFFHQRERLRADAFAIHVIGAEQQPAAPFPLRRIVHCVERLGQDAPAQPPFELARVEPGAPAFRFARERQAAAQQLGEDLRASRAFKQHRAAIIFALGGLGQRFQVLCHLAEDGVQSGIARQVRRVEREEGDGVMQHHAIRRLRHRARPQTAGIFGRPHHRAFRIHHVVATGLGVQFHARIQYPWIIGEDRGQRAHPRRPLVFVDRQAPQLVNILHPLGVRKVVGGTALGEIAPRRALARNGLHGAFVSRIGGQPQIAAQHRIGVVEWPTAQVIACATHAAGEVRIVELVIAHAHGDLRLPDMAAAPRQQAAERSRDAEGVPLVDHVLNEVRGIQIGDRQFARARDFVAHGRQHGVRRGSIRRQCRQCRGDRGQHQAPHCPPPFSALAGSGSSGGRSFALAFFSISISDTRIAGDTADTGTLPLSAPQ